MRRVNRESQIATFLACWLWIALLMMGCVTPVEAQTTGVSGIADSDVPCVLVMDRSLGGGGLRYAS